MQQNVGRINGTVENSDDILLVGNKGISTTQREIYEFPSDEEYSWCASCQIENNILVFCKNLNNDEVESTMFNPIVKQWNDVDIKIKRKWFAVVEYFNRIWGLGENGKCKILSTLEMCDPVIESRVLFPIKMIQERSSHNVIVYKQQLFVFGGCNIAS